MVKVAFSNFANASKNRELGAMKYNAREAAGGLPAEIVGSNPTGGMDICLL